MAVTKISRWYREVVVDSTIVRWRKKQRKRRIIAARILDMATQRYGDDLDKVDAVLSQPREELPQGCSLAEAIDQGFYNRALKTARKVLL